MIDTRDISLILLESCCRASSPVCTVVLAPLGKPAYCHCSHSQVLITGAELVVTMGNEQAMSKIASTLRTGKEREVSSSKRRGEEQERSKKKKAPNEP